MEKDKQRNDKPISNWFAPQEDPTTIATIELFVSDSKIQKEIKNAADKHQPNAGRKVPSLVINYDGQCKINKSAQSKEGKGVMSEAFGHRVIPSTSSYTPNVKARDEA